MTLRENELPHAVTEFHRPDHRVYGVGLDLYITKTY